jgi:FkbM family methyltransferase
MNTDAFAGKWHLAERRGHKLLLDSTSLVDSSVLNAEWESEQISYLFGPHDRGEFGCDVFLDIGSYWGLYSLEARKRGISEIVAFEPDPMNFCQLKTNLMLNNAEIDIRAIPYALSDVSKNDIPFNHSRNHPDGNRGGVGLASTTSTGTVPVDSISGDELLTHREKNIILKIDVEGHEEKVIRGLSDFLQNNRIWAQVEIFPEQLDSVHSLLTQLGFLERHRIGVDYYFSNFYMEINPISDQNYQTQNQELQTQNQELQTQNQELQTQNQELQTEKLHLEHLVQTIQETVSWRITKPLRSIKAKWKRLK